MIRILNAEPLDYSDKALKILQQLGTVDQFDLERDELKLRIPDYDVLIVRLKFQVDRELIDRAARLKVIVTATTGLDHIDVPYAEAKGIHVLSLRGHLEFLRSVVATAEHTWALLLALTRRVPWAFDSVLDGYWDRTAFRGHDLKGQTLGIVGLGRIGEKVAAYSLAFGMEVLAYDPYRIESITGVHQCSSLAELLGKCRVLSIHVPLNDETVGMIAAPEFDQLPPNALLINTSRGKVIDEHALIQALQSGKLAGAALDVIASERDSSDDQSAALFEYARTHNNLLITPHISGATFEAMAATEIYMAQQVATLVNSPTLYSDTAKENRTATNATSD